MMMMMMNENLNEYPISKKDQEARTLLMKGNQVSLARTLSIMRILLIVRMQIQQLLQQNNVLTTKILRLLLREVGELKEDHSIAKHRLIEKLRMFVLMKKQRHN